MFIGLAFWLQLALLGLSIGSIVALLKRRYKAALQCAILAAVVFLGLCWLANSWGNAMRMLEEHRKPESQPALDKSSGSSENDARSKPAPNSATQEGAQ